MKLAIALALSAVVPAAASVAPASPAPPVSAAADPTPYFLPLDLVEKIECGNKVGSGSRIDSDTVITATHVVDQGGCTIRGKPAEVIYSDPNQDFSVLRAADKSGSRMAISCAVPVEGAEYFAIGYAFGEDFVVQPLTGTASKVRSGKFAGMKMLRGNIYPGMSGGPVIDRAGSIVGIVNAAPRNGLSSMLSLSLSGTYLCAKGA
jgi:S1-C subfamily serine protease